MNGSPILNEAERQEMLLDGSDQERREAFRAARMSSQSGTLDDYIDFLSRHIGLFPMNQRRNITEDFRL